MWKVSWFYEKVHNIANFWGYTAILTYLPMVDLPMVVCPYAPM